jgi:hypothetical protein
MKKNKTNNKNNTANKQIVANTKITEVHTTPAIDGKKSLFSSILFEDKISIVFLLCIILLVILIRSNFLSIPFERDEGSYGYYGKLLFEGKIPYKDFYEQKFPGLFYLYGFMYSIFGDTVRGMHTGFIWLNIATIITIYYASRTLFTPIAGIISATTFAIVSLDPFLSGFTIQSEHGVAFFISLGLLFYALFTKKNKWYLCFFMGVAFGCSLMIKTNGVFLVFWGGLILILDFFFDKKRSFKELFSQIGIYSGGVFLFVTILFLVIFLKGSFKEMMYWAYYFPKEYVGKISLEMGEQMFKYNLNVITQNYMFFWVHSLLAIVVCLIKPVSNKMKAFTITLLIFSFLTIVPGLYFYGHYWIQILPGLSVAAGMTCYGIITLLQKNIKFKGLKYIYLSVFGLFVFSHVSALKEYYFEPDYESILRSVYGDNPFPEAWEISEYINAHSKPEDGIAIVGSEPEIYFYTKKKCPSRHAYFSFLVWDVPESAKWQREFTSDVEKAKPRFFIFFNHGISLLVQKNTDHYIFDWMKKYIDDNYRLIGIVDMIDGQHSVYKWNEQINNYKPAGRNVVYIFDRKIQNK